MVTLIFVNPVDDKKDLMMILSVSSSFFGTEYILESHLEPISMRKQPAFQASKFCLVSSLENAVGHSKRRKSELQTSFVFFISPIALE